MKKLSNYLCSNPLITYLCSNPLITYLCSSLTLAQTHRYPTVTVTLYIHTGKYWMASATVTHLLLTRSSGRRTNTLGINLKRIPKTSSLLCFRSEEETVCMVIKFVQRCQRKISLWKVLNGGLFRATIKCLTYASAATFSVSRLAVTHRCPILYCAFAVGLTRHTFAKGKLWNHTAKRVSLGARRAVQEDKTSLTKGMEMKARVVSGDPSQHKSQGK